MNAAARRYAQTQSETASPERLMVLLFQRALQHIRTAAALLEKQSVPAAQEPLTKATNIVMELHRTLDAARAPELCEQLGSVYRFVALRLNRAVLTNDPKLVREAERAFFPLADAFEKAVSMTQGKPTVVK